MNKKPVALALILLASPAAFAAGAGPYFGIAALSSSFAIDADDIDDGSFVASSEDNRDTGFRLGGGYRFSERAALEVSWIDAGSAGIDAVTDGSGWLYPAAGLVNVDIDFSALAIGFKGFLPLGDAFYGIGRIGLMRWQSDVTVSMIGLSGSDSVDGTDPHLGIGLGMQAGRFALELGFSRYDIEDAESDSLELGLVFAPGN